MAQREIKIEVDSSGIDEARKKIQELDDDIVTLKGTITELNAALDQMKSNSAAIGAGIKEASDKIQVTRRDSKGQFAPTKRDNPPLPVLDQYLIEIDKSISREAEKIIKDRLKWIDETFPKLVSSRYPISVQEFDPITPKSPKPRYGRPGFAEGATWLESKSGLYSNRIPENIQRAIIGYNPRTPNLDRVIGHEIVHGTTLDKTLVDLLLKVGGKEVDWEKHPSENERFLDSEIPRILKERFPTLSKIFESVPISRLGGPLQEGHSFQVFTEIIADIATAITPSIQESLTNLKKQFESPLGYINSFVKELKRRHDLQGKLASRFGMPKPDIGEFKGISDDLVRQTYDEFMSLASGNKIPERITDFTFTKLRESAIVNPALLTKGLEPKDIEKFRQTIADKFAEFNILTLQQFQESELSVSKLFKYLKEMGYKGTRGDVSRLVDSILGINEATIKASSEAPERELEKRPEDILTYRLPKMKMADTGVLDILGRELEARLGKAFRFIGRPHREMSRGQWTHFYTTEPSIRVERGDWEERELLKYVSDTFEALFAELERDNKLVREAGDVTYYGGMNIAARTPMNILKQKMRESRELRKRIQGGLGKKIPGVESVVGIMLDVPYDISRIGREVGFDARGVTAESELMGRVIDTGEEKKRIESQREDFKILARLDKQEKERLKEMGKVTRKREKDRDKMLKTQGKSQRDAMIGLGVMFPDWMQRPTALGTGGEDPWKVVAEQAAPWAQQESPMYGFIRGTMGIPATVEKGSRLFEKLKDSSQSIGKVIDSFSTKGGSLGRLGWVFTSLAMSSLGVYFSLIGIVTMLQKGIGTVIGPLGNLQALIQGYAASVRTFGEGPTQSLAEKIFGKGIDPIEKWIEASMYLQGVMGRLTTSLATFGAALILDPEVQTSIETVLGLLEDFLARPEIMQLGRDIFKGLAEAMPAVLDAFLMLGRLIRDFVLPNASLFAHAWAAAIVLMPIFSFLSAIMNIGKALGALLHVTLQLGFAFAAVFANPSTLTQYGNMLAQMGVAAKGAGAAAGIAYATAFGIGLGLIIIKAMDILGTLDWVREQGYKATHSGSLAGYDMNQPHAAWDIIGMITGKPSFLSGKAAGGPLKKGQAAIVGELGPEIIMPSGDVEVIPNKQIRKLAEGTGISSILGDITTSENTDATKENTRALKDISKYMSYGTGTAAGQYIASLKTTGTTSMGLGDTTALGGPTASTLGLAGPYRAMIGKEKQWMNTSVAGATQISPTDVFRGATDKTQINIPPPKKDLLSQLGDYSSIIALTAMVGGAAYKGVGGLKGIGGGISGGLSSIGKLFGGGGYAQPSAEVATRELGAGQQALSSYGELGAGGRFAATYLAPLAQLAPQLSIFSAALSMDAMARKNYQPGSAFDPNKESKYVWSGKGREPKGFRSATSPSMEGPLGLEGLDITGIGDLFGTGKEPKKTKTAWDELKEGTIKSNELQQALNRQQKDDNYKSNTLLGGILNEIRSLGGTLQGSGAPPYPYSTGGSSFAGTISNAGGGGGGGGGGGFPPTLPSNFTNVQDWWGPQGGGWAAGPGNTAPYKPGEMYQNPNDVLAQVLGFDANGKPQTRPRIPPKSVGAPSVGYGLTGPGGTNYINPYSPAQNQNGKWTPFGDKFIYTDATGTTFGPYATKLSDDELVKKGAILPGTGMDRGALPGIPKGGMPTGVSYANLKSQTTTMNLGTGAYDIKSSPVSTKSEMFMDMGEGTTGLFDLSNFSLNAMKKAQDEAAKSQAAAAEWAAMSPEEYRRLMGYPSLQAGGMVGKTGMIMAHAGEVVAPADKITDYGMKEQNITINITINGNADKGVTDDMIRQIKRELYGRGVY